MEADFRKRYIDARKKVIEKDFAALNPMQRKAVMATEGPLLILAGAGSGKTTVLIDRIVNLIRYGRASDCDELPFDACEEDIAVMEAGGEAARRLAAYDRVDPWNILAITFTNKAANELKERLERKEPETGSVWASTFHSACVTILRRGCDRLGYPSSFTIYDSNDSKSLIKRILKDMELDEKRFPPLMLLKEISKAKDNSLSPSEYRERARSMGDIRGMKLADIYSEYAKRCFSAGAMDFDDLIYNTVKLLRENEDIRDYWQNRFRYVLVDEYQDTDLLQYQLVSLLSGGMNNLCVVGDDDQSIYKFRGATIENILCFEDQFHGCRVIRLEQNYRSTSHILDAANAVIRNNTGRKGKNLWTDGDRGDMLELYVADNEHDEARYVAMQLMSMYSQGSSWSDSAVLYRMNAQSNQLEQAFKRSGIPYKVFGGTGFFDRAEVKDMLAYLCVIASPADDLRLERIINNPPRGIGPTSVERAAAIAAERGTSLYQVIAHAENYPELSRAAAKMTVFARLIAELKSLSEKVTPDELYDALLERSGYLRMLEEKGTVEDDSRAENVKELKSSILDYVKNNVDPTLEGYLADVALYSDLDTLDGESGCVSMMSMHHAKGLEFENVFIVGAEEGIFPGTRSIGEPEELEEERRLCYVAITRAKKRLFIVCAKQRMLFGKTTANRVSRFIDEIPAEHINKRGIPRGYGYSEQSYVQREFARKPEPPRERPVPAPSATKTKEPPKSDFSVGDRIRHKAFGTGEIASMKPMGNDCLIEIAFDNGTKKKLMLRAAVLYMEKI